MNSSDNGNIDRDILYSYLQIVGFDREGYEFADRSFDPVCQELLSAGEPALVTPGTPPPFPHRYAGSARTRHCRRAGGPRGHHRRGASPRRSRAGPADRAGRCRGLAGRDLSGVLHRQIIRRTRGRRACPDRAPGRSMPTKGRAMEFAAPFHMKQAAFVHVKQRLFSATSRFEGSQWTATSTLSSLAAATRAVKPRLPLARLGTKTALVTINLDLGGSGQMSCNPAVGGIAKGHVVREDRRPGRHHGPRHKIEPGWIQFRLLNRSRRSCSSVPASPGRPQPLSRTEMPGRVLEATPNSTPIHRYAKVLVIDLTVENGRVIGVTMQDSHKSSEELEL